MRLRLILLAMLALPSAARAIPPPVVMPVDPGRLAAAADIWRIRPLDERIRNGLISGAVLEIGRQKMLEAGIKIDWRWAPRSEALGIRLRARIEAVRPEFDKAVMRCLTEYLARALSVDDLVALKSFVATESGGRFWEIESLYGFTQICFDHRAASLLEPHMDEDIRAARAVR